MWPPVLPGAIVPFKACAPGCDSVPGLNVSSTQYLEVLPTTALSNFSEPRATIAELPRGEFGMLRQKQVGSSHKQANHFPSWLFCFQEKHGRAEAG